MELIKSLVHFDEDNHRYTLSGKTLSGITSVLSRQLFPKKYENVPEEVLERAKQKGTMIHDACELYDDMGLRSLDDLPEVKDYCKMIGDEGLNYECSEYLVSDNENYASCIDKVYRVDDKTFILGDIKTTYSLDIEYIRWQLSIYAYLFELQNSECKVSSLIGIWLREGKSKIVEVERIPNDIIINLLATDAAGLSFENPLESSTTPPDDLQDVLNELYVTISSIKHLEDTKKALEMNVQEAMSKSNTDKWETQNLSVTKRKASIREDFDKKRFKEEHPEEYLSYIKQTQVKESLTIKIKKDE